MLEIIGLFSILLVLIVVLVKSADLIAESFVYIAKKLAISEFFLGFVILGAVATLPEIGIVINSAREIPTLSIGNALGGMIIVLTLLLGIATIRFKKEIHFVGRFNRLELILAVSVIALGLATLVDGYISFAEGLSIILACIIFVLWLYRKFNGRKDDSEEITISSKKMLRLFAEALVGVVLLLASSTLTVDTVVLLGEKANMPESLIGIFILAIGTNLTEITILLRSKKVEQEKLSTGNILGSAFALTMILGLVGLLSGGAEIKDFATLIPSLIVLPIVLIGLLVFTLQDRELSKIEGKILLSLYGIFVIVQVLVMLFFFR